MGTQEGPLLCWDMARPLLCVHRIMQGHIVPPSRWDMPWSPYRGVTAWGHGTAPFTWVWGHDMSSFAWGPSVGWPGHFASPIPQHSLAELLLGPDKLIVGITVLGWVMSIPRPGNPLGEAPGEALAALPPVGHKHPCLHGHPQPSVATQGSRGAVPVPQPLGLERVPSLGLQPGLSPLRFPLAGGSRTP